MICKRGMKVKEDFDLIEQTATCRENNTWDPEPEWKECVPSKSKDSYKILPIYYLIIT